jgi:hypothetical protein
MDSEFWERKDLDAYILAFRQRGPESFVQEHQSMPVAERLYIARQLAGVKKAESKFPSLASNLALRFPPAENMEQSSSEATAAYKARLIGPSSKILDGGCGFGMDTIAFLKEGHQVMALDPNPLLTPLLVLNVKALGLTGLSTEVQNLENYLTQTEERYDWIYIDPSRRVEGRKLVQLADLEPNVIPLLPTLLKRGSKVLVKLSPLLDLKELERWTSRIRRIHVVEWEGECKEILAEIHADYKGEPEIMVSILSHPEFEFRFTRPEEADAELRCGLPTAFLFEPGPAIMKAGPYRLLSARYGLTKLHPLTHFYASENVIESLPGKWYRLLGEYPESKAERLALIPEGKAGVSIRQYPGTAQELQKKLGLKDGGSHQILACTIFNGEKKLLVGTRLKVGE